MIEELSFIMKLNSYVLILLIIFFGKIIGSFTVI